MPPTSQKLGPRRTKHAESLLARAGEFPRTGQVIADDVDELFQVFKSAFGFDRLFGLQGFDVAALLHQCFDEAVQGFRDKVGPEGLKKLVEGENFLGRTRGDAC